LEIRTMQFVRRLSKIGILFAAAASLAALPAGAWGEEPMRTGKIHVVGNKKIKDYIILREVPLRTGQPYDKEKVDEARRRVRKIPGVDYSEIRVFYTPIDSSLSLNVVVTEKSTFTGFPIIRRGPENVFSFGAWVAEYNFRGRSETIGASLATRGGTVADVFWENPWLGRGPRVGIGLSGDYNRYKYVYDDLGGVYEGQGIQSGGGKLSLFYTFGSGLRPYAEVGYRLVDGEAESMTIKPDGDRFPTVTLGILYDGRSSTLYPWSGWYLLAETVAVGPGDDAYSIVTGHLDARVFLPIFNRVVFGLQGSGNIKDGDDIPVYMREHLGGGMTIRGYDYGTFNATNSVLTGAELRVPINFSRELTVEDQLFAASFHLFADAGAVWEQDESLNPERWHGGFGAGVLLLNSAFRGVRFDYAWNDDLEGLFHFEIGARF
jgi:outer membrane protein assembly factor BamA